MFSLSKKKMIFMICLVVSFFVGATVIIYKNYNNKVIFDFAEYINEYKTKLDMCILGNNEDIYKKLLLDSEKTIANKDKNNISELKDELNKLQESVYTENTNALNNKLGELKNIDISKLTGDKQSEIGEKISDIDVLIKEKKFKEASDGLNTINETINNEIDSAKQLEISNKFTEIDNLIKNNKFVDANKKISELESQNLESESKVKLDTYKTLIKQNSKLSPEEAIKRGLVAKFPQNDVVRKWNSYIMPVEIVPHKTYMNGYEYNERIAKFSSNSKDTFLITDNKYDNSSTFDEKMSDFDSTLIAWIKYDDNEKCYWIQYQSYYHILLGGNANRFNRKIYDNGTIQGNYIWNEPYMEMKS